MAKKKKSTSGIYSRRISHGSSDVHDLRLKTRKESRVLLSNLSELWGGGDDGRERLALFLLYNKSGFDFLSIDIRISEDCVPAIIFIPAEKVGCAPLISPISGKVCASIVVTGNMNEDISEVLPLIEGNIDITFSDKLVLPYKASIKPPLYFECAKYIDQYIKARRLHWQKFISEERFEKDPSSSTLWAKYAASSYDPYKALIFPNKKNLLSENHTEWRELNYVLKLSLDEMSSSNTPRVSKSTYKDKVEDLRRKADFRNIIKPTELRNRAADPLEIKELKQIGNRILSSIASEYRAWHVDFSNLFERYVQYVFSLLAKQIGARVLCNNKFAIFGSRREWGLAYLEPDIIITKGDNAIMADAKYKMHLYNSQSEKVNVLKESFRHDLHQILAYSSFEKAQNKMAMLVYPCNSYKCIHQKISAPILSASNDVYLIGVPWGECSAEVGANYMSIQEKIIITINGLVELFSSLDNTP